MSGGSWDYICFKLDDLADSLGLSVQNPYARKAVAKQVRLLAKAMHAIEWNDSGDGGQEEEEEAIAAFLGDQSQALILSEVVQDGERVIAELKRRGCNTDRSQVP